MTDDQSRRPDPSLKPDADSADELAADDETLDPEAAAAPEPDPETPPELDPEAAPDVEPEAAAAPDLEPEAAAEPEPELEPEPQPEPGPQPAAGRARTPKAANAQATRNVGYRGSLPPRNDHIARPWVITVIAIFALIFLLAIAGLPSRLLPDATPAPIPSFSLEPLPTGSAISSPQ